MYYIIIIPDRPLTIQFYTSPTDGLKTLDLRKMLKPKSFNKA